MERTVIEFPEPLKVRLVKEETPRAKRGELLVQTNHSIISTGTESIIYTHNFAPDTHWARWARYPFRPGYLNSGVVLDVGEGVEGWKPGDRVSSGGKHQSIVNVDVQYAVHVPDEVSSEDAAWTGLGRITQMGIRAAQHRLGDSVVVIGVGLLGQIVIQYLRLFGAKDIIAIDTSAKRLEMATAHGATATLKMSAADALAPVQEITKGRHTDVVYDITGHHAVLPLALPLARNFGTVVLLGDTGKPSQQVLTGDVVVRGLRIVGAHGEHPPMTSDQPGAWVRERVSELFLAYVARKQMCVSDLVTHRYTPDKAGEAFEMLQTQRDTAMGVVFEWGKL